MNTLKAETEAYLFALLRFIQDDAPEKRADLDETLRLYAKAAEQPIEPFIEGLEQRLYWMRRSSRIYWNDVRDLCGQLCNSKLNKLFNAVADQKYLGIRVGMKSAATGGDSIVDW